MGTVRFTDVEATLRGHDFKAGMAPHVREQIRTLRQSTRAYLQLLRFTTWMSWTNLAALAIAVFPYWGGPWLPDLFWSCWLSMVVTYIAREVAAVKHRNAVREIECLESTDLIEQVVAVVEAAGR